MYGENDEDWGNPLITPLVLQSDIKTRLVQKSLRCSQEVLDAEVFAKCN